MTKKTIGIMIALTLLVVVTIAGAANREAFFGGNSSDGFRNLVLYAWGTGSTAVGQIRIPVPAHGATYEAIVSKPGQPQAIPVAAQPGR